MIQYELYMKSMETPVQYYLSQLYSQGNNKISCNFNYCQRVH